MSCPSSANQKRRHFEETVFVHSMKINVVQNNTEPYGLSLYVTKILRITKINKKNSFVFCRIKNFIQVWNDYGILFWLNYPSTYRSTECLF